MSEESRFDYGPVLLKDGPPELRGRLYAVLSRKWIYADGPLYARTAPVVASVALNLEHGAQSAEFRNKHFAQAVR